jgi:hypothetical protein
MVSAALRRPGRRRELVDLLRAHRDALEVDLRRRRELAESTFQVLRSISTPDGSSSPE